MQQTCPSKYPHGQEQGAEKEPNAKNDHFLFKILGMRIVEIRRHPRGGRNDPNHASQSAYNGSEMDEERKKLKGPEDKLLAALMIDIRVPTLF